MHSDDWAVRRLFRTVPKPAPRPFARMQTDKQERDSLEESPLLRPALPVHYKETDTELAMPRVGAEESKMCWSARCARIALCLVFAGLAVLSLPVPSFNCSGMWSGFDLPGNSGFVVDKDVCPQASPISPLAHSDLLQALEDEFLTEEYKLKVYESLGGSVRIPTVMYDDLAPPGEDSRWEIFADFHDYLEQRFPLVHKHLLKNTTNLYALVYHWQGSDASLKPILLTAHQDVVPVDPSTFDNWVNPPFSGYYDGEWIWGRGSGDDKSGLIGVLTAIETLIEHDFKPTRSVVLAFGIDEERGGISGATAIRDFLLTKYGKDAFSILVDEGGGQDLREHALFATPAVAEKGHLNVRVDVATPGGHSSVPPPHTGIGILANLITRLEENPHEIVLLRNATYYQGLLCEANHDPDLDKNLRHLIKKSIKSDKALAALQEHLTRTLPTFKAIAGTTQAVDIIHGGVKANALPETSFAIVNHRIAGHSSVGALKNHITRVLQPVASRYNLSVDAFGELIGDAGSAYGQLVLSDAFTSALEPAPITPTIASGPYQLLSGTIRNTIATSPRKLLSDKKAVVAPTISLGNTDTKHYWDLTKHIFRYGHKGGYDSYNGAHTVNEAIRAEGFLEMIRFFTQLILNADQTDLL